MKRNSLRFLIFLFAGLATSPASALVTFDAYANAYCGDAGGDLIACGGGGTTLTYSLTVGSQIHRAMAVFISAATGGAPAPAAITSVTYAGVALNQITTANLPGSSGYVSLYALPAGTQPTSGTNNIIVTLAAPNGNMAIHSGAISVAGVDQTTTFTSSASNAALVNGTTATVNLASSGAGDLVFSAGCSGTSMTSTTQSQLWVNNVSGGISCDNDGGDIAFGGTTTLSWTIQNDWWGIVAASFKDAGDFPCCQSQFTYKTSTANTHSVAITVAPTGPSDLLVIGTANNGTRTITGVSDGTNAFVQAANAHGVDANLETDIWYLLKSTSGKTTITITYSGANGVFEKDGWFWEVRGFHKPVFDLGNKVNAGVQAGGLATGASVTTTGTRGLVIGIDMTSAFVSSNPAPGNEFTSGGILMGNGNAGCSLFSSTAAAHQPVWTDSGGTFASSTAAFKDLPLQKAGSY